MCQCYILFNIFITHTENEFDEVFKNIFSVVYSNRDDEAEVLYYSLEKGNMASQIKHNPWSLQCHQQHLQRMKENSKHRNQHSILLY